MCKYHYENIFNSVEDSRCDKVHFDCVTYNTGKTIDAGELMNIINELSCNKSPGLYGLTAEHIKFADSQLVVLLSILVSSILVHGNIPKSITESVIVLAIKDKNRRVNEKGNYRPTYLSMDKYLQTKGLQTLLDICYTYGCEHNIQYNAGKSLVMYYDSRNANLVREMTLGKKLNFATSYKYL